MNWTNVKLIWLREVRDQLRDRRTLFMIAVLPVLLYPLLGMVWLQVTQFLQEHPTKALIVGLEPIPGLPPLIEEAPAASESARNESESKSATQDGKPAAADQKRFQFNRKWAREGAALRLPEVEVAPASELHFSDGDAARSSAIRQWMREKDYDVVVLFPANFSQRLENFRRDLRNLPAEKETPSSSGDSRPRLVPAVPAPEIYYDSVKEKSAVAFVRVSDLIRNWQEAIGRQTLRDNDLPEAAAKPFEVGSTDVAEPAQRQAAVWSKILPFVLLIWALTGAFYPAIDLCAGEKERGTLETLLCSPAERTEIVTGKLLAVMLFSIATSLLNMASLGVTGLLVMRQFGGLGAPGIPTGLPPLASLAWLALALVPASALFSALCLALAAFARSSKEGQYYLMPLVLVTMPLMVLPMAPGVELTLGNSLIPLTGLILLLRMLLEGNLREALPFIPPVVIVTLLCCRVAMRWAADQFDSEQVLFRESERWDMRLWFKHLRRDRGDTPTLAAGIACGVLILAVQFILGFSMPSPSSFAGLAGLIVVSQVGTILIPVLAMTFLLTRRPRRTLLLRRTSPASVLAAIGLAIAVHPLYLAFQWILQHLYPVGAIGEGLKGIERMLQQAPFWWLPLVLMALLPAVCEELAFRGFILSGLRHSGHKWRAILLSSLFFAVTHQIFQQSLGAFVLGSLIAYLAVQTGSIWPGLVFHAAHNALAWLHSLASLDIADLEKNQPTLAWLAAQVQALDKLTGEYPSVGWIALLVGALAVGWLVNWFSRLTYWHTAEEWLQETIEQQAAETLHV
jgi:sodium transport system permease protein